GLVSFANSSTGIRRAAVTINGTSYWGPPGNPPTSGTANVAKTQVFSLQAGDTVQLACWQNTGGNLSLSSAEQTRMFLAWLCEEGSPAGSWVPPDTTFRWQSGTAGDNLGGNLSALLQVHLG